jgi:ammonium transporter, Amt family
MPQSAPAPFDASVLFCVILIFLVPFAAAGIALINTGLGRSRSAAHTMMCSLCVFSVAALAYFVCGFAWQGFAGGPSHAFSVNGKQWSWIAAQPFLLRHLGGGGWPAFSAALLGLLSVGVAALIPLGSGVDRWRLGAACVSATLFAAWTFPLFAHWVWGGGWLALLGVNYGLGHGFVDVGGSSTIQAVGGLTALSVAWILGPRRGKYTDDGMPSAIPGHNSVLVLFGCMLALVGWWGLNCAGAILFSGLAPFLSVLIAVNTGLAAAAAALTAAIITYTRFGKPDASLTANGWIGGLAASSGACAFVQPAEAVVIGAIAGILVTLSVEWFELRMRLDDPCGSISAHGVGGLWGVLSVGFLATIPERTDVAAGSAGAHPGQLLAQLIGIATLMGFVLPLTYGLNWTLNQFYPQRVAAEGERQGMDLYELGAGAYPESVTHGDEFIEP